MALILEYWNNVTVYCTRHTDYLLFVDKSYDIRKNLNIATCMYMLKS